tara:strand:+ start:2067 stop:2687 length:621 start_codon:yes stop_codon:yes gene_type:complete
MLTLGTSGSALATTPLLQSSFNEKHPSLIPYEGKCEVRPADQSDIQTVSGAFVFGKEHLFQYQPWVLVCDSKKAGTSFKMPLQVGFIPEEADPQQIEYKDIELGIELGGDLASRSIRLRKLDGKPVSSLWENFTGGSLNLSLGARMKFRWLKNSYGVRAFYPGFGVGIGFSAGYVNLKFNPIFDEDSEVLNAMEFINLRKHAVEDL